MAKRKQLVRPSTERKVKRGFEDREDFTDQGITIKWSWIRRLLDFLKQGKINRRKRNREKYVNTKVPSGK